MTIASPPAPLGSNASAQVAWLTQTGYTSLVGRSSGSVVMTTLMIGAYQAVYFESVAQAVEYCHALVPHIVPRRGPRETADDRAVVWFHVPARSRSSSRDGCYLFASAGAIAA